MRDKKYIFLTNNYMPKPGATGVCVHQLAKHLVSQGEEAYVICYGDGSASRTVIDGVNVVKIRVPFYMRDYQESGLKKRYLVRAISLLLKFIYYNKYPLRSRLLVRRYVKAVSSIQQQDKDSVLIASYTPLEGVVAAAKCKIKMLVSKAIYYSTDTLSNEQGDLGLISAKKRTELGIDWEKKLFSIYDRVILMECHREHYNKEVFRTFSHKIRYASFPLIINPKKNSRVKYGNKPKRMLFAGNLYRKMRNPFYICKLLMSASDSLDIKTIFMGGGDCSEELKDMCERSNGLIEYIGFKPYSYVERELLEADVLLSIGNSYSEMCPSKIYEYMSTGKPIVHVYSYEKDPCLEPLSKYGNSVLLKEGDANNKDKLVRFFKNVRVVPFEEIEVLYKTSTPEYSVKLIKEI